MDEQLIDALEVCLVALHTGVELENCLALYPDISVELRTALEGARYAQILACSEVPTVPLKSSRARFRMRVAQLDGSQCLFSYALRFPRLAFIALLVILVFSLSWNGLLVASAKSLPGDSLYPVKRAAEKVVLSLPTIIESRHEIENVYYHRRAEEVENLFRLGRSEKISLEGVLTELSVTRMIVEGIPVVADASTRIFGKINPGMGVEVEGLTNPAGFIQATEIHLRYYALVGKVNEIGQTMWIIAGSKIRLLPGVQIDPSLHVGDQALALVYSDNDGALTTRAVIRLSKYAIEGQLQKDPSTLPGAVTLDGVVASINADTWVIGSQTVSIAARTEIKEQISVGSHVIVHGWQFADGILVAAEILKAQPLVEGKARDVKIKPSDSLEDDPDFEAKYQENDPEPGDDMKGIKASETNDKTSVKESEDGSHENDLNEVINSATSDKHGDSGGASGKGDHGENIPPGESESDD